MSREQQALVGGVNREVALPESAGGEERAANTSRRGEQRSCTARELKDE